MIFNKKKKNKCYDYVENANAIITIAIAITFGLFTLKFQIDGSWVSLLKSNRKVAFLIFKLLYPYTWQY